MEFDKQLEAYRQEVEAGLKKHLPSKSTHPASLHESMRYSVDAGGKRLRPILVLAGYHLNPSAIDPMPAAVAVEALHTYSLIHDDLPCMDNSDLRRGRPTCHKAFDEATALLAGDALLTESFLILSRAYSHMPQLACELVHDLADAAGSQKLIGGQVEDLIGEKESPDANRLDYIHKSKTAALIQACLLMGVRLAQKPECLPAASDLGYHMGVAFQIIDDILDATTDTATLGKTAGLDDQNGTLTYPKLYGLEASRLKAKEHTDKALRLAEEISGGITFLPELVRKLEHRIK